MKMSNSFWSVANATVALVCQLLTIATFGIVPVSTIVVSTACHAKVPSDHGSHGGLEAVRDPVVVARGAPKELPADRASAQDGSGLKVARMPQLELIQAPQAPTETGNWWAYWVGTMDIDGAPFYDPHGVDFQWAYSRKKSLPKNPRIVVHMHGSGGGTGAMGVFGPSMLGDIEVRAQDAEAHNQDWREWWAYGADGKPYPGRRIAAALDFIAQRYQIDGGTRGLVLDGPSMGGAGSVIQTMILPSPWREQIAYSTGRVGVMMPRQIYAKSPGQYRNMPPDNAQNRALWDSIDFTVQAKRDPIVRGIHYRHSFSSNDQFSVGLHGSTQLEFVNVLEAQKMGGAFTWVKANHGMREPGVNLPDLANFEAQEQDVTLDRAHPAITQSTGNHPLEAAQRIDEMRFPRGHYNMGITWDHSRIEDTAQAIVFPLKYQRRKGMGKGIPDQPKKITVSVTPRRPANFALRDGETLHWSWDNKALTGTAVVQGDTVTVTGIPLTSGDNYRKLRIFHK